MSIKNPYSTSHQIYEPYDNSFAPDLPLEGLATTGHTSHLVDPSPALHHNANLFHDTQPIPAIPLRPSIRPRKKKAPTLRADAWEPYKDRIVELHITQGLPLREVKKKIEEEFGFTAEERQYRTRIRQWGKGKNIKPEEMRAIVRKRQRRKLVEVGKGKLVFTVRGSTVEPEKIDRWMKRNGVPESFIYAPSPAASTPSDVYCQTISERGSPVPSLAYSPAAPILSLGGSVSIAQSPQTFSPAPSIASIARPQSSIFTRQSPASTYRSLPSFLPSPLPTASAPLGPSDQEIYKSAEEVIRRLVEGRQIVGGNDDINTLEALEHLRRVLSRQELYTKAENLHRRTFESRKAFLGAEHAHTLASMVNLASTYWNQGRWKEAEELEIQVIETFKRVLGPEHQDTLISMGSLASTYRKQGRWDAEEELEVQVVEIRKRILGLKHPDTLISMGKLASTYRNQGRWEAAEELEVQVIKTRKRILGDEHPSTLFSMGNLAWTFWNQGRRKEAEELEVQVMETSMRVLGAEHPDTLNSMNNLAFMLKGQGRIDEAISLMERCLQVGRQAFGHQHPYILSSLEALNDWYKEDVGISL